MSSKRELLLQLYNSGAIDNDALQKGIRIIESEEEKKYKQLQKDVISELKKVLSQRESGLRLVDNPKCGYFKAYEMFVSEYKDPNKLFNDKKKFIIRQITEELEELGGLKFQLALTIQFYKDDGADVKMVTGVLHGDQMAILTPDKIDEFYNSSSAKIQTGIEKFTNTASGLEISHCIRIYLNIAKYEPLKGLSKITLPEVLFHKKAIINLPNEDGRCFEWALLSTLYYNKNHPSKLSSYRKYLGTLNLKGIDVPTPISQIPKVEKQNSWFAINVYGCTVSPKKQKVNVFPYYISDRPPELLRVNLLLVEVDVPVDEDIKDEDYNPVDEGIIDKDCDPEGEGIIDEDYYPEDYDNMDEDYDYDPEDYKNEQPQEKETMYHYCGITRLDRLLHGQNNKSRIKTHFCDRCLYGFTRKDLLDRHTEDCYGINKNSTRIDMPPEGSYIYFKNHQNQMPVPFVIYADFESVIKPKSESAGDKSEITSEHVACGFGYQVVRYDGQTEKPVIYRGENAIDVFLGGLECEVLNINNVLANPQPIITTEQDEEKYKNATHCFICKNTITKYKVSYHSHFTGKYIGAVHKYCYSKLNLKPGKTKIPVVIHNLRGYDSHLIMQRIHKSKGNITCISNNAEKYISFSIGQLKFIDSFQFMASSLERLVDATDKSSFKITKSEFGSKAPLILRKGVYPYEYIDSLDRFDETQLPPIDKFFSKLNDEGISQKDYEHAQKVWEAFKCKTLGDYHDLYLKTDINLLADVFQTFRKTCMGAYRLDPLHYYTSPGLSWDALLKYSGEKLELLTDMDMHLFIEKGMRGGISMVSKRYAKANNPLTNYDPEK